MLAATFSSSVFALDNLLNGEIQFNYTHNDNPLDDVDVRVYQVAELLDDGTYAMTQEFADIEMDFYQLEVMSYWINLKNEIEHHVDYKMITPDYEFVTDDAGNYNLDDLDLGLYYITAEYEDDGLYAYYSEPLLIFVGQFDDDLDKWVYEFTIIPKISVVSLNNPATITVNKTWENINNETVIPNSIEVELYCNGEVVDTVTLSEENSWSYTWENIDIHQVWAVYEKTTLTDFEVSYDRDYFTFEIINTYIEDTPQEQTTTQQTTTQQTTTEQTTTEQTTTEQTTTEQTTTEQTTEQTQEQTTTTQTTIPSTTEQKDDNQDEEIPKTGSTVYLAQMLAAIGIIFILVGLVTKVNKVTSH